MKISKYTQFQLNWARENETLDETEIDYRTKLATGMSEEQRQIEFENWKNGLNPQEKKDFEEAFGE